MPVIYSTQTMNARMVAVLNQIDSGGGPGWLEIYTANYATLLCSIMLGYPGAETGTVANGIITLTGFPRSDAEADADGVAAVARISNSASVPVILGLTVGTANADIILQRVEIGMGEVVTIGSAQIGAAGTVISPPPPPPPPPPAPFLPELLSVVPSSGEAGTVVTITGQYFGSQDLASKVWFGSAQAAIQSWENTQIVCAAPVGLLLAQPVRVENAVGVSPDPGKIPTPLLFTYIAAPPPAGPTITSILPTQGVAGTTVTITGTAFGASQGAGVVRFGAANAIVLEWGDTSIRCQSPAGLSVSDVAVITAGGTSNSLPYTYPALPPPNPGEKPADLYREVNRTALLNFRMWWNEGSRYIRFQFHTVLESSTEVAEIQCQNFNNGGAYVPFQGTNYVITCDGVAVGSAAPTAGASRLKITMSLSGISPGYHVLDIIPSGSESSAPFPIYIPGGETPEWLPTVTGSYEIGFGGSAETVVGYRIMWVPARFEPTVVPLPTQRTYTHFNTALSRTQLSLESLVVKRGGNNVRMPARAKGGELTTQNRQWYTTDDMVRLHPRHPFVDGPRGKGSLGYLMHLEVGTAAPVETGPINNIYGVTPWSIVKIRESGECKTLSGYRSRQPDGLMPYWEDIDEPSMAGYRELVGDWSAIPQERWGYRELWGMAWNSDSFIIDTAADPIPSERNLRPHDDYVTNGVMFSAGIAMVVSDSQNNRIVLNKFSPTSHTTPPQIFELITGLQDPWDIIEWGDHYIISERKANRIVKYTKTGIYVETIVEGAMNLAVVTSSRLIQRNATVPQIRAQPCCLPEGIYRIKDNQDDWLYWGSAATAQIRRINMLTREIQVVQSLGPNSSGVYEGPRTFNKIAVSDGTFGPRGTIFISNWLVTDFGFPHTYLPDGAETWNPAVPDPTAKATKWSLALSGSGELPRGTGGVWEGWGYTGAVGVGNGRLIGGGASAGIYEITKSNGEPKLNATLYAAGRKQYTDAGYHMTHGTGGYGFYGLPLPWGVSAEIDYYLQCHRHIKP